MTRLLMLQYLRCKNCGLVFVNPLPAFADIDKHCFEGECDIVAWKDQDWNYYVDDKLSFINAYYEAVSLEDTKKLGRVLDVSCGPGVSLDWLRNEKGWQVTGIDPDLFSQRRARELYGLDIQNGLIDDLKSPPEHFDLIIMDNALEHYFNPMGALLEAYRFLRKGGYFCIIVPNADGLSTLYLGANLYWGHWFAFTPRTLAKALRHVGFEIHGLIADQNGNPPAEVVALGVDVTPYLDGLSAKCFGPDTITAIRDNTYYADYFSLIAIKPDNAPEQSLRNAELLRIAQRSKVENPRL